MKAIRKAEIKDLNVILELIQWGREKMIQSGNTKQWGNQYPTVEQIENDIKNGNSYLVLSDKSKPIATFAFIIGEDSTYLKIDGRGWLNDKKYGTIHRIASLPGVHGIFSLVLHHCFKAIDNIRIDTHEDNIPMRNAIKKLGFTYCGIIYLENGDPRLAYQKVKE